MRLAFVTSAFLAVVLFQSSSASAQNVFYDYFNSDPQFYAPEDFHERGWIYRAQAGFTGLFRDCDDDAAKRNSPYIYWQQRQPPECRRVFSRPLPSVAQQIQEQRQFLADGAGACAAPCECDARLVPTLIYGIPGRTSAAAYPPPAPEPIVSYDSTVEPSDDGADERTDDGAENDESILEESAATTLIKEARPIEQGVRSLNTVRVHGPGARQSGMRAAPVVRSARQEDAASSGTSRRR